MSATRLGILLGIAGALAILAWRVVDEYERELRDLRTVRPTPGYRSRVDDWGLEAQPAVDPGPLDDYGDDPFRAENAGSATAWAWIPLAVLVAIAAGIIIAIAIGAAR